MDMDTKNLKITYIGGGSRGWARVFMTDLALESELGGEIRLYDIDNNAATDNETIGNCISEMPESKGKWKYKNVPVLETALDGADFVIISILPGTFEEMRSDVHLPERLGIYQSVGDTAGPGGIIRVLRTIPQFYKFAKAIEKTCPNAWVINYTNPMSLCVRALYDAFPAIKAFGCCHEVFGTQELLAAMVEQKLNVADVKRNDIHVNVLGVNHFTWFNRASWKSYDLMEMFRDFADEFEYSGFKKENKEAPNKCFTCTHRVKFDLFKKYGLIAAAGDRHLAEFIAGDVYLRKPETAESWGFYLTSVDWRVTDLQNKLERSKRLVNGIESITLKPSGEEGILLIKALCGLTRVVSNVNLPNTLGQIGNFPHDTITETNAVFSFNNVSPLYAGDVPDNVMTLMQPHIDNQKTVLEAAVNCDRKAVYRAFETDPLVKGRCSDKDIHALADDMINNTLSFLAENWRK